MVLGTLQAAARSSSLRLRPSRLAALSLPLRRRSRACSLFDKDDSYKPEASPIRPISSTIRASPHEEGRLHQGRPRNSTSSTSEYPMTDWSQRPADEGLRRITRAAQYDERPSRPQRYRPALSRRAPTRPTPQYLYAIVELYDQIPDITRDQEPRSKALGAFQELVERYPKSEYADDAKFKIQVARDQLAGKEMEVGRFYLKKRNYPGAVNRFQVVVAQYQPTRHVEEALQPPRRVLHGDGHRRPRRRPPAAVLGHNYPGQPVVQGRLHPREVQRPRAARGPAAPGSARPSADVIPM